MQTSNGRDRSKIKQAKERTHNKKTPIQSHTRYDETKLPCRD